MFDRSLFDSFPNAVPLVDKHGAGRAEADYCERHDAPPSVYGICAQTNWQYIHSLSLLTISIFTGQSSLHLYPRGSLKPYICEWQKALNLSLCSSAVPTSQFLGGAARASFAFSRARLISHPPAIDGLHSLIYSDVLSTRFFNASLIAELLICASFLFAREIDIQ